MGMAVSPLIGDWSGSARPADRGEAYHRALPRKVEHEAALRGPRFLVQGRAVLSVEERDDPLDGGQPEPRRVRREIQVRLRGEVRPGERESGSLDVEAALARVDPENARRRGLPLGVEPEGALDRDDALLEGEERRDVAATE